MKVDQKHFTRPQLDFMKSMKDRVLLSGAVGAGKTLALCSKGFWLGVRFPGNRGALVRKSGSSLKASTLKTLLVGNERVDPVIPEDWVVEHNKNEKKIVHKTRKAGEYSEIIYTGVDKGSKDSYPKKLGSTEFGWIGVDEAIEIDKQDWEWLETRLRYPVPVNQIFGATNPSGPEHWLYDMFIRNKSRTSQLITATPYDNPFLDQSYIDRLEERYQSGIMRDRMLQGKWVAAQGLVYPEFNRDNHVISGESIRTRQFKDVIIGADSGWKNPRALLVGKISGSGDLYIVDEFYETKTSIEQAIEWLERNNYKQRASRMAHDPSEPEEIEKASKMGIRTDKAVNDIIPGIGKVSQYIGEKGPDLYVKESCTNLITEFASYKYPDDSNRNQKEEKPIKKDDHLMDALRYMIMELDQRSTGEKNIHF